MKKLDILLLAMVVLSMSMVGCRKADKFEGVFDEGNGQNVSANVDSKVQTLSFKYDKNVTKPFISSIANYINNIITSPIYEDTIDSTIFDYNGDWYTINSHDDYLEVQITQNTSADSRGISINLRGPMLYVGTCIVMQSGAQ